MDYHSVFTICHNIFLSLFSITAGAQTILLFAFSFLLIISFLVSGSQVAFFSLSSKELNVLKTHKQPSFRRIVNLLEKPKNLYASLVITGTTVNIGIVLVCNVLFDSWLAGLSLQFWAIFLIKLAAVSLLLALFAEILPKVWATHHKIWFAATASLVIEVFASIFSRLSRRMVRFSDRIERNFSPAASTIDDNRIDNAIDLLPETEVTQDEKRILKGIRKFGEIHVKQIMRTRMDVCGLDTSLSFSQLLDQVRDLRYSRIPVYHGNLDDIKGMLHTKDLIPYLDREAAFDWQFLIRKPFFVHEQKFIEDLLQDFRNRQIHFAIVVDEFGGTSGIVTLEDIMEEIIGDIKDEFDDEESVNKKIDDFNYVFEGKTMIHEACKAMDLPVDTFDGVRGESDSLAGLVLEIAGEFPQVNEQVSSGDFTFIPLALTRNRIEKIKVVIKPSKMA